VFEEEEHVPAPPPSPKRRSPGAINLAALLEDEPCDVNEVVVTAVQVTSEGLFDDEEDSRPPRPPKRVADASPSPSKESPRKRKWDSANAKKCSAEELSRADVEALPRQAHLLRKGPRDDWALPYRDAVGRINRPLLKQARDVLSHPSCDVRLSRHVLAEVRSACETAWPGVPLPRFPDAESDDDANDDDDGKRRAAAVKTSALVDEAKALLDKPLPAPVKATDVSASLLFKLKERRAEMLAKKTAAPSLRVLVTQLPPRQHIRLVLEQQARQVHVAKLLQKAEIKKQVSADYEAAQAPGTVAAAASATGADGADQAAANDDDDDEDDSEFTGGDDEESGSSSGDDESSEQEDELPNGDANVADDVAANPAAVSADDAASSQVPATTAVKEEEDRNKAYRAMLLAEERAAKRQRGEGGLLENEASEEEDEDEVGNYGGALAPADKEGDEDEGAIRVQEDDLRGIVDSISDDEDKADITELYRKQAEERDAAELKRLQRDVENHTLMRRRRGDGTRIGRALDDPFSDDESDEELELARVRVASRAGG